MGKKYLVIIFVYLLIYDVRCQTLTTITYDTNGNRIAKNTKGSTVHPAVVANPVTVNIGASTTLTASGCPAGNTVRWQSGQTGASISAPVYESTSFVAECISPTCPTNGEGKAAVSVIMPPCNGLGAVAISTQAGNWSSAATWYCGKVPTLNDVVLLRHQVSVDVNGSAQGFILSQGFLTYPNSSFITLKQN